MGMFDEEGPENGDHVVRDNMPRLFSRYGESVDFHSRHDVGLPLNKPSNTMVGLGTDGYNLMIVP